MMGPMLARPPVPTTLGDRPSIYSGGMNFVPFDATEEELEERQVLRPGVPKSMRASLTSWVLRQLSSDGRWVYVSKFHELENNLDIDFHLRNDLTGVTDADQTKKLLYSLTERELLRVVDYSLAEKGRYSANQDTLKKVLADGRSMYEPVQREESYRLASRVPEGVHAAAEQMMALETSAGLLLRKAWSKVYDLEPDDSGAYAAAVKSVEAAALPALGIDKETGTVANAIRAIEAKEATWRLPFKREHTEYPSKDVLLGLLKSIYRGQRDRHGNVTYSDVTHQEAQAAVLLAVTLVGWFSGDLVQERDTTTFG
jgi:hypothetical protein